MSGGLDMSLDDIIKSNRKPTGGSRGRSSGGNNTSGGGRGFGGSGSGSGPSRRFNSRVGVRSAPYARPIQQQQQQQQQQAHDALWQNDVFATDASVAAAFGHQSAGIVGVVGGGSSIETGTKLYISNLEYGVSNEDIKELFSEVGELKRYGIHYDRSGRSKGTAEVVFSRRGDALAAVKRYNNVQLDGKLMKVEIVGANVTAPAPAPAPQLLGPVQIPFPGTGILGFNGNQQYGNFNGNNFNGNFRGRGRGGFGGRSRGGGNFRSGRGGRGSGGGGGRGSGRGGRDEKVSAEDLDAELDKYHKEAAMET